MATLDVTHVERILGSEDCADMILMAKDASSVR
jgi:hypothetical protein